MNLAHPCLVLNGHGSLPPKENPPRTPAPRVVLDSGDNLMNTSRRDLLSFKSSARGTDFLKQVCK